MNEAGPSVAVLGWHSSPPQAEALHCLKIVIVTVALTSKARNSHAMVSFLLRESNQAFKSHIFDSKGKNCSETMI